MPGPRHHRSKGRTEFLVATGLAALAQSHRDDLASLGPWALLGAKMATLMTGALAGLLYPGQSGVLGV